MIWPLVNNYAAIFRACAATKEQLKPTCQQSFESHRKGSFKDFLKFISGSEKHIRRMWSSNNLNGFMSLMEAVLTEQQTLLVKAKPTKPAKKAPADDAAEFKQIS